MKYTINRYGHRAILIMLVFIQIIIGCAEKIAVSLTQSLKEKEFLSEKYNHFEGGVLFANIQDGLTVLWQASFKHGRVYKENLGFFVDGGLLIFPNKNNTRHSSSFSGLYTFAKDGKLFVEYSGADLQVLGIIHTHPDKGTIQEPTARNDYQFGYLGIHNYILSKHNLFVAYKDSNGIELFDRLGSGSSYYSIPFITKESNKVIVASK